MSSLVTIVRGLWIGAVFTALCGLVPAARAADDAQWIWSAAHARNRVPRTSVYFRKSFELKAPEQGQITIGADDHYDLYVNGKFVGSGDNWKKMDRYDLGEFLAKGKNTIAVKVDNQRGSTGGLVARVSVKERNGALVSQSTDGSWIAAQDPWPLWTLVGYNDNQWAAATELGAIGKTPPWIDPAMASPGPKPEEYAAKKGAGEPTPVDAPAEQPKVSADNSTRKKGDLPGFTPGRALDQTATPAAPGTAPGAAAVVAADKGLPASPSRFRPAPEFRVELVVDPKLSGSLLAMTFNEFGQIVASKDGGGLVLIYDSNKDGIVDKVRDYCDQLKNVQGLLCLNGDVFAVGEGPDGPALYRCSDKDRNASLETIKTLIKFKGPLGEHGPHGVVLGPDGMLYVMLGNHTAPDMDVAENSPHQHFYEGDLLPRYEDPGGHAVGIKTPGGTVIRTDTDGSFCERICGGIRNAYDLCFNRDGELFTHDSDMEADEGTTWYRPTRVTQLVPGGEYGWRSGWATWPDYFVDSLPAAVETGRGSPTGMIAYDHFAYPIRYHNTIFSCDWALGRIMAIHLKPNGAGYTGTSTVFLEGEPLNVTDIEVGPDGALYFSTGGRDLTGGVYRIMWNGKVPEAISNLGSGIEPAIRQPQPQSAWARQKLVTLKQRLGPDWEKFLRGTALSTANPAGYRTRALDLLQLFGPSPSVELLHKLARDKTPAVRAKAVWLLGIHGNDEDSQTLLTDLLADDSPVVRRAVCEAMLRLDYQPEVFKLLPVLEAPDRFESAAARQVLQRIPVAEYEKTILEHTSVRVFLQGSLAMLAVEPNKERAIAIVGSTKERLAGNINDRDFLDLLRMTQVALLRGGVKGEDVPEFAASLADEFPSGNKLMNRELVRLLAYLQVDTIHDRYQEFLAGKADNVEKVHLAVHLRFIEKNWTTEQKLAYLRFCEDAIGFKGGASYPFYLRYVMRDFGKILTLDERKTILAKGHEWPNASLAAIYGLPPNPGADVIASLRETYEKTADKEGDNYNGLHIGITAVLAREGDEPAMQWLREQFDKYPERRGTITLGLAQQPDGENWKYLVRALPILDGMAAQVVLNKLATVQLAPEEPEYYRQVIIVGLRLKEEGAKQAIGLLEHWTGEERGTAEDPWEKKMALWQAWFSQQHPGEPPAKLPTESEQDKWKYADIAELLTGKTPAKGDAAKGALAFEKALCSKCHKMGTKGESFGPDLTAVSKRFQTKEILEAVMFPAQTVSDQYAAKQVVTKDGRTVTGFVAAGAPGEIVLVGQDGRKSTIKESEIDEIIPTKRSPMPSGLLNHLTEQEIVDLMAYLRSGGAAAVADRTREKK